MILPDVNVLIYAFRADSSRHALCRAWLDGVIRGEARFGLSPMTLSAVVRIVSNSVAFADPNSVEEAFAFCEALREQPHCQIVEPGDRHWRIFRQLCLETGTRGPAVTDAWLAALAIEHGCAWITCDRDFARFPGLDWRAPTA